MNEIASLKARVGADISDFKAKMADVDRTLSRSDNTAGKTRGSFMQMGGGLLAMAGGTAAVSAAFIKGINVAADFEVILDQIGSRAGLTGPELEKVSDFALEMGAKTKFSGQEAAEGLLQLMTSGNDLAESMKALGPIMNLASVEGLDLGRTSDSVTDILSMFGLTVDDVGKTVQTLGAASQESSAKLGDILAAFENIGPIAKQFGLDVEDTAAILAVFADNGIKGAEAGTQLKSVLMNMDSDGAKKAMADLGVSMYDAKGNAREFGAVLAELREKMEGMTTEEKNALIKELGGSFGALGLSALLAGPALENMNQKMAKSRDISEVAAANTDNWRGKMEELGGSLETLATKALTPVIDKFLTPMTETLIKLVNNVAEGDLLGIAEAIGEIGVNIAALPVKIIEDLVNKLNDMKKLTEGGMGTTMGDQSDIANQAEQRNRAANLTSKNQGYSPMAGGLIGGMTYEQWVQAIQNGTSFIGGGMSMDKAAQTYQTGGPDFLLVIKQSAMELDKLNQAFGKTSEYVAKLAKPSDVLKGRTGAVAEGMGIEPGPLFKEIWETGLPMDATFEELARRGMIAEDGLQALAQAGLGSSDSLAEMIMKGLVPAEQLYELLNDPSIDLTPEARALLQKGIDVRVQVMTGGGRTQIEERDSGGRGLPGRQYFIGVPEVFTPDVAGTFTPVSKMGGGDVIINVTTNDPRKLLSLVRQGARQQNLVGW